MRMPAARWSSRAARRSRSTSLPRVSAALACSPATASSSPTSSTTRISCRGRSSASRPAPSSSSRRSTNVAKSNWTPCSSSLTTRPSSWASRTSRTRWAPYVQSSVSSSTPGHAAFPCSWTAPRECPTLKSTCRRSAAISTRFRDTRCSDRRARAFSGGARRCSTKCRRGKAVAT